MERTDSVLVQGDLEKLTEEVLTLYFSNKKRSGGGEVQSFIWINTRKSAAITFRDSDGSLKHSFRFRFSTNRKGDLCEYYIEVYCATVM